jgi:hypothetical protein
VLLAQTGAHNGETDIAEEGERDEDAEKNCRIRVGLETCFLLGRKRHSTSPGFHVDFIQVSIEPANNKIVENGQGKTGRNGEIG